MIERSDYFPLNGDYQLYVSTQQVISFPSWTYKWNPTLTNSPQKRNSCLLVYIALIRIEDEPQGLVQLDRMGKPYFVFLCKSPLRHDWLQFHQPQLKYKLYLIYDRDSRNPIMKSSYHPLGKGNSDVSVFPMSKGVNLFPDYMSTFGFEGRTLKVAVAVLASWLAELHVKNERQQFKRGIEMELLNLLMRRFNFSGSFRPSSDGGKTGRIINGTWNGCLGDVIYDQADIGTSVGMTHERHSFVTFSQSYNYARLTFVVGNPSQKYTWKSLFRPLGFETWLMVVTSTLITLVVIRIQFRFSKKKRVKSLSQLWAYTLETLIEQGSSKLTASIVLTTPLCLYFSMWFIFTIVVGTAYRSKLVAVLMFPEFGEVPKTFEELANSDYKLMLLYLGGLAYEKFRTSSNPSHRILFDKLNLESSKTKCVEAVIRDPQMSCILWNEIVDYLAHSKFSDANGRLPFLRASSKMFFTPGALIMKKNAYAIPSFDIVISRMTSMGIFVKLSDMDFDFIRRERMNTRKLANESDQITGKVGEYNSLSIPQLEGAFAIFFAGILLSVTSFAIHLLADPRGYPKQKILILLKKGSRIPLTATQL